MKYAILMVIALIAHDLHAQAILYSELNGTNWDIHSVSANGAIKQITTDKLKDFQSDYSGKQKRIVFDSYRDRNTRNIFTYNPDNEEVIQLTDLDTRDGHPVWSPHGNKIAFQSSRTGNPEVFVMDSNGKNVEQLTFKEGFDGIPKWSADGQWLAINSNRDGSPNVFVLQPSTKNLTQVTRSESFTFVQEWISTNQILVITDVANKRQMQIVDIKGTVIRTIATEGDVTYARANGNDQIVFTQKSPSGGTNVFLTDVKGNNIKQLTHSNSEKRFPAFMER